MKKLAFMALAAIAATTFTSCGNQASKASLKTDVDTLSYAFGMAQSQQIQDFFQYQDIDSAHVGAFLKGLAEGAKAGDDKAQAAYYTGVQLGQTISRQWVKGLNGDIFGEDSTKTVSLKNIIAGLVNGVNGKYNIMTADSAQTYFQVKSSAIKRVYLEQEFAENKAEGEKFLAENANKEGVVTLESGLQYKVITEGTGAIPTENSMVKVNYEGKLVNGEVFDSSYDRGAPATMRANQVIAGWQEALCKMPVGSKWELYIPQDLAYQERNTGKIKPFSALVFTIELLDIVDENK